MKLQRKFAYNLKVRQQNLDIRLSFRITAAAAQFHPLHAKSALHLLLETLRTSSRKQSIRSICPHLLQHEQACLQDVFVLRVSKHDYKFTHFLLITPSIKLINFQRLGSCFVFQGKHGKQMSFGAYERTYINVHINNCAQRIQNEQCTFIIISYVNVRKKSFFHQFQLPTVVD